jgi:hypothetical protein
MFLCLSLLTAALAAPQEDAAVNAGLEQVRLFIRRKWYSDAAAELALLLDTPAGRTSFEAHWLGAQLAWLRLDAIGAEAMAARAIELTQDPERRQAAVDLHQTYVTGFGRVQVDTPYPGMASIMQLERVDLVFDPELKGYINGIALQWRDRVDLPVTVSLPVGRYLIQGIEVDVRAAEETRLQLEMDQIGARGLAALQVTRLEVAAGMGLWFGERMANQFPSAQLQLALSQPVGRALLGVSTDVALQTWSAVSADQARGPIPWSAGVRIGTELVGGGALAIRPSLLLRGGRVAGVGLDCVQGDAGWFCGTPDGIDGDALRVYTPSMVALPGIELSVDYRQAGRTTAVGSGVKLVAEQAIGVVPTSGVAEVQAVEGVRLSWTSYEPAWTATRVQMLANLSFAF